MKKAPHIWELPKLLDITQTVTMRVNDEWVPVRPISTNNIQTRLKATWLVFTGKADAVVWPAKQ